MLGNCHAKYKCLNYLGLMMAGERKHYISVVEFSKDYQIVSFLVGGWVEI